ncbi:small ribosomal subunit protein mS22 [Ciona intestinalis]
MSRTCLCRALVSINRQNAPFFIRTVYSGPESTPDFTKNSLKNDESWETKKLKSVQERVALLGKGVKFEGDERIIDNEARRVFSVPHQVYVTKDEANKSRDFAKNILGNRVNYNKTSHFTKESNVDPDFARPEVQAILKTITGCDPKRVFEPKLGVPTEMPTVKFLTTEQLKKEMDKSLKYAEQLLEMPPVMLEREEIDEVIAEDENLDGYEACNVVFTDISENLKLNERFVVVREPSGSLRKAKWAERDRVQQVYFSKPGKTAIKPKLLENMKIAFKHDLHENILMQTLIQHEPDSSEFIRIHQDVYNDIDNRGIYDNFRSTRFFGGLAFYLTKYKSIDGVLIDMVKRSLISDAVNLIQLFCMLHPESKTTSQLKTNANHQQLDIIEAYMNCDCNDSHSLKLAVEAFQISLESDSNCAVASS